MHWRVTVDSNASQFGKNVISYVNYIEWWSERRF